METMGVTDMKPDTGDSNDSSMDALRKHKSPLFRAIDGITNNPKDNGLNAAATSGVSIARSVMDRASIDQETAKQIAAVTKKTKVKGLTADGLLDEDDE